MQIIASVDPGGRSTSQHSQLGRSSSTPQVYLMMTAGTHQPLGGTRVGAGEIRKFLLGVPFHEQRNEVTDRRLFESVQDRAHGVLHGRWGYLRELRGQAINHLPDQVILFGGDNHPFIVRHHLGFSRVE